MRERLHYTSPMKFSSLTQRLVNESPNDRPAIDPWAVHNMATQRIDQGEQITLLSIGQETDETTPAIVVEAAIKSLQSGRHHYAEVRGDGRLRMAVANYHNRLTGQQYDADAVTIFGGAQNALFSLAQVLLEASDEVLLVAPFYTTYEATFGAPGPTVVSIQVEADNDYQLDVDKLLAAVTPKTRAIVLNAPNNPLGSRYSKDQLEKIVKVCVAHQIWLILDAVYLDIVSPESTALPHTIAGANDILITVGSLSKSHRMTGWRIGWAIGPAPLAEHLANLSVCMHYGLSPFIMDAATVAIEQSSATPLTVRSVMQTRRKLAVESLNDIAPAKLIDPGEGMFLLLDVEPLGVFAYDFAVALLDSEGVSVLPCDGFGPGGRYLVRIGLCVDGEALANACVRIGQFIQRRR
jgi:arginine:pyruvate transaminase